MRIIFHLFLFSSTILFAQADNSSKAIKWIEDSLSRYNTVHGTTATRIDFRGQTPRSLFTSAKDCGLHFTKISNNLYFVVVALTATTNLNNYIGVSLSPQQSKNNTWFDGTTMRLKSESDWGNDSRRNEVSITLDSEYGLLPLKANGVSDLFSIGCEVFGLGDYN